jgi:hypothetical protein
MDATVERWTKIARDQMLGCLITDVRYMTYAEKKELGWNSKGIVLTLHRIGKPDILVFPSRDDEGNDAGALFTTDETNPTIPVI